MSNNDKLETVEVQYLNKTAEIIKFDLFATHLFSGLGYGAAYFFLTLSIGSIFTGEFSFFGGAILMGFFAYLCFKYAHARSNAKIKQLKVASVLFLLMTPLYLITIIPFFFIFLTNNFYDYPALSGRGILSITILTFTIYLSNIYVRSQIIVWSSEFREYSKLIEKTKRDFGPLYGLLPQYAKSAPPFKRITARFLSSISALLLGIAVMILAFYPIASLGGIIVDSDGNFKFGDLTNAEAIIFISETGGIEHYWLMALGGFLAMFILPAVFIWVSWPFRKISLALIKQNSKMVRIHDSRPAVIYLRSFSDDKVKIKNSFFSLFKYISQTFHIKRLDELFAERLWYVGPVIALSNPNKKTTSLSGPVLKNEPHGNWKNSVAQEINVAKCIIVNINTTESLKWEIDQCLIQPSREKSFFVTGLKSKKKRIEDVRDFCLTVGICVDEIVLEDTILILWNDQKWVFYCTKKRRIFDYDAALLKAASTLE